MNYCFSYISVVHRDGFNDIIVFTNHHIPQFVSGSNLNVILISLFIIFRRYIALLKHSVHVAVVYQGLKVAWVIIVHIWGQAQGKSEAPG